MPSNNFGAFLSMSYHGWFTERLKDVRSYIDRAFMNSEGGLQRNTIPFFCLGDGPAGDDQHPIIVDAVASHEIYIGAYQINYGLGYWAPKAGFRLYALEGNTGKDYNLVINVAAGAAFVLAWAAATETLTISIPNDESGTLAGLRTALLADATLREMFAVSGTDAVTLVAADVMASTAITAPGTWGTGVAGMAMLADLYFSRLEPNWAMLHILADQFSTALDAFLPLTLVVEVWNDGQLMQFHHLAQAEGAE